MEKLDPNSHDPLYRQLARKLINQIKSDTYLAGQKIPSIRQLSQDYDVSTITVVRALDELRKHQYIYSVQGKGNFVAHHKIIRKYLPTQDGFTDMAEKVGLKPSSIVLRKEIQPAGSQMGKEFGMDPESEMVILERIRLLDGFPICIQVSYLPHELSYGILEYDFSAYSLYQVLREYFHIFMAKSQYNIQAGLAEERELKYLDLQMPAAILWIQHWAFDSSGRLFEYGNSAYRADCFQIKSPINEYEITSELNG
jgi:DNA-binding GntR family transcriptional regulator